MAHIGVMPSRTSVVVTSSNGENGTISGATEKQAGVMTATQVAVLNALAQKMGLLVIEGETAALPPPLPDAAPASSIDLSAYAKKSDIPPPADLSFVHQRIEAIEQQIAAAAANIPQAPAEDTPAFAFLARELDDVKLAISDLSRGWNAQQEIVSKHIKGELEKLPDPAEIDARIRAIEERVLSVEERPAPEPFNPESLERRLQVLERKLIKPVIDLGPVLERLDAVEQKLGAGDNGGDIDARLASIERRFEEADDPIPAFLGGSVGPSPSEEMERKLAHLMQVVSAQAEEIAALRSRPDFSAHVVRYDLALRAKNGNVEAMALLSPEAEWLGVSVGEFADQLISERTKIEQLVMRGGKP